MSGKTYIVRHGDRREQELPFYVIFDESESTWSCCISPEYATTFPTMKAANEMKEKICKPSPARLTVMTLETAKEQFDVYIGVRSSTRPLVDEEINVEYDPSVHTKEDVARYWKMFSPGSESRSRNINMIHEKVLETWPTVNEYYPHFFGSKSLGFRRGLTYESFVDSIQLMINAGLSKKDEKGPGEGYFFRLYTEEEPFCYLYVDGETYWLRDREYRDGERYGMSLCGTPREIYDYGMEHLICEEL